MCPIDSGFIPSEFKNQKLNGLNHLHNISSSSIAIFTILIWGFLFELFGRLVPDVLGWAAPNTRQMASSIIHQPIRPIPFYWSSWLAHLFSFGTKRLLGLTGLGQTISSGIWFIRLNIHRAYSADSILSFGISCWVLVSSSHAGQILARIGQLDAWG